MDKLRKIHCVERMKKGFDDLGIKKVRDMCGYYEPEEINDRIVWEVTLMFEGEGMTCKTQTEAESVANQHMIMSLMLQLD